MGGGLAAQAADAYLVGHRGLAGDTPRGGEQILETACVAAGGVNCEFPAYPGTVGWKFGFQQYRDARVTGSGGEVDQTAQKTACQNDPDHTDANCRRRFDRIRRDLFHYTLYAHARARPKSTFPCLDADNKPTEYSQNGSGAYTGTCAVNPNPNFTVPKSISGTADLPGANVLITLGLWGDAATPFVIASTTLHELGHNLNLWHGGVPAVIGHKVATTPTTYVGPTYVEPNCKPNFLSSMSYLFQVHGLYTDEDADGDGFADNIPHLDYSGQAVATIDEHTLGDGPFGVLGPTPTYQPAWFAPLTSDLAIIQGLTAATKYCNGSKFPFDPALPGRPAGWVEMARAQAQTTSESINWDGNSVTASATDQNVNFDGTPLNEKTLAGGVPILTPPAGDALYGYDDWGHLRLDQIGAGRASGRFKSFAGSSFEGSSFEGSSFEGSSFEGSSFEGSSFEGSSFEGSSFEGSSFEGSSFEGSSFEGSSFEGSSFEGSSFEGSSFEGSSFEGQELDLTSAKAMGRAAPHSLKASNITDPDPDRNHQVHLTWKAPTWGTVASYQGFRLQGGTVTAAAVLGAASVGSSTPDTSTDDPTELPDNTTFIYFVKAQFDDDPPASRNSNFAKITAVNDAPVANPDGPYTTPQNVALTITHASLLDDDTDDDSPTSSLKAVLATPASTYGPFHGAVTLNAGGTAFVYTPTAGYSGPDQFAYIANDGIWTDGTTAMSPNSNAVTLSITVTEATPPVVALGPSNPAPNTGGWNNTAVTVLVTATDPSGVASFSCTDNGSSIAVGSLSGIGTTSASGVLNISGDGTHNLACTATDGATPPNSGAAAGSANTRTVKIDTTAPAGPTIGAPPAEGAELSFGPTGGLGPNASVHVHILGGRSGTRLRMQTRYR